MHHLYFVFTLYMTLGIQKMIDSYIIVFKSLILLGSDIKSKSLHKRIGYSCIFLSGMILYWLWEAMLISFLIINPILPSVDRCPMYFNDGEDPWTQEENYIKVFDFFIYLIYFLFIFFQGF